MNDPNTKYNSLNMLSTCFVVLIDNNNSDKTCTTNNNYNNINKLMKWLDISGLISRIHWFDLDWFV